MNQQQHKKLLENCEEQELYNLLPNIKHSTIHIVYEYLHRPRGLDVDNFAYKYGYSASTIYKYLKRVRDEYNKL